MNLKSDPCSFYFIKVLLTICLRRLEEIQTLKKIQLNLAQKASPSKGFDFDDFVSHSSIKHCHWSSSLKFVNLQLITFFEHMGFLCLFLMDFDFDGFIGFR